MSVTIDQVRNVARLARLRFSDEEEVQLVGEMNRILAYMDKLNELETDHVEPLLFVFEPGDTLRPDEQINRMTHGEAMKNAPDADTDFFRVPKVIG